MAKSKKSAANKSGSNTGKNTAAKGAAATSSASVAASKASSVAADAKADIAKVSSAVADAKATDAKSVDTKADVSKASTVAADAKATSAKTSTAKPDAKPDGAKTSTAKLDAKPDGAKSTKTTSSAEAKKQPEAAKEAPKEKAVTTADKAPVEKAAVVSNPTPPPAEPEAKRGGFLPLVLGGVIAAGLGYFVSEWNLLGTRGQSDELRTSVEAQDTRLSALESAGAPEVDLSSVDALSLQVAGSTSKLEELSTEITSITGRLETLQSESTAMAGRLDEINTRLTDVEKRPITENESSEAAVAAYERELAALTASIEQQRSELQSSVDEQRAEIEALLDNAITVEEAAAETARVAGIQKALTDLSSAIDAGEAFDAPLAALAELGVESVPAALSDVAADGVQTLSALQTDFPDNARASLNVARASGEGDAEETGVAGFFKRQLGARSVTPKEGSGPDAVLSRAEAAVKEGRLDDALGEIDALPAPAQEAMQDWLDAARARAAALVATQDLSQSLTAN